MGGVNSYSQDNLVAYSTIADATSLIKQGTFLAKIDLKSAYRSVPISSSCYDLTGLHWYFKEDLSPTFLYDCRLPFGASKSCKICSALTDAVTRMLASKGYTCLNDIDDFLVIADSELKCKKGLDCLIGLVESLGFEINWKKVEQPARIMVFLGVKID
jgi:hypothetical protein